MSAICMKARKMRTKEDIKQIGLEKRYDDKHFAIPVSSSHVFNIQEVHLLESQKNYGLNCQNSPLELWWPTKMPFAKISLLVEHIFWYSACSKYRNAYTRTHTQENIFEAREIYNTKCLQYLNSRLPQSPSRRDKKSRWSMRHQMMMTPDVL